MPRKDVKIKPQRKSSSRKSRANTEINTRGAFIQGNVNTSGGDFAGRDLYKTTALYSDDVSRLFERFYEAIQARSNLGPAQKTDIKAELKQVEGEVAKGDSANAAFLSRRLRNLGRMAPDILDVVLTTLASPASGLTIVARKVAEKIKNDVEENKA